MNMIFHLLVMLAISLLSGCQMGPGLVPSLITYDLAKYVTVLMASVSVILSVSLIIKRGFK